MKWLERIFDGLSGEPIEFETRGSASSLLLIVVNLLAAAFFSALFGVAVGSTMLELATANVVKVPMVVVMSGLFALPTAVLGLRMLGSPIRATELWMAQAIATLAASLVLASTAPLVGLFYHSSETLGGITAVGAAAFAVGAGLFVFGRALMARGSARKLAIVPAVALVVLQMAALAQLVGLASPILPEVTPFSQGMDGMLSRRH